jgi:molybdopterin-guanine dinucleotide biosynthesis protein A
MAARHLTRSAAILAGGQATRFRGQDKGALLVDGRAILDRQLEALAPLTDDIMIVGDVARGFQPRDRSPERAAPLPREVHDIVPGCGPLGGLHAALTAARGEALLLVACDMPYLSSAFVAHLFSLAGDADIVVPQSERGYHPLCAVYTNACLEPVAARLGERRLKMRELLDSLQTCVVPLESIRRFGDPDRLLTNVNTPADYAGLEALHDHKL